MNCKYLIINLYDRLIFIIANISPEDDVSYHEAGRRQTTVVDVALTPGRWFWLNMQVNLISVISNLNLTSYEYNVCKWFLQINLKTLLYEMDSIDKAVVRLTVKLLLIFCGILYLHIWNWCHWIREMISIT